MQERPDRDGWMETWISCALDVRQRQVKGEELSSFDDHHCYELGSLLEPANPGGYDDDKSNNEDDGELGAEGKTDDSFPDSGQSSTTCKHSAFIQRRELTLSSRYPSTRGRGPPDGPRARPWTASAKSHYHAMPSNFDRCYDTRGAAPAARPRSAAGAIGRRSGGGVNAGHMASAGRAWVREIAERVAPRRPASSRGGNTAVKGDQPRRGSTQKAVGAGGLGGGGGKSGVARGRRYQSSRMGQGCHRRAGQSGQVRVLAAWSYEVSKRHGQDCGGASPPRQILVKVPCVKASGSSGGGGGGGGKKNKRWRDAPYRLAFNHEVNKSADDRRTRNVPDSGHHAGAVPAGADDAGNGPGGPDSSDSSVDSDAVCATLAAKTTSSLAGLAPPSSGRTAAVTVQLPRPTAGEEVSSTTTDGRRGCNDGGGVGGGYDGSSRTRHGFSSTGLGSASESSGWQSLLEENEKTPSTSRVIAKLRASVARDTRPSSAASVKPTTASAAAAGSGLLPVPVMEVRLGDGIAEAPGGRLALSAAATAAATAAAAPCILLQKSGTGAKPRPRPQSAAGVGAAVSRMSSRTGCQRPRVPEGCGGATGRISSGACTHDSAHGGVVLTTDIPRIAEWEKRSEAGLRPKSAGMVNCTMERRRMDLATQGDYSFFPSTPADKAAEEVHRSDLSVGPFWGGAESLGDVTEWENSLCSSVVFVTSTVGDAIDTPRSWKEPADI